MQAHVDYNSHSVMSDFFLISDECMVSVSNINFIMTVYIMYAVVMKHYSAKPSAH